MKGFFDILHKWGNPLHGTVPFADIKMTFSSSDPTIGAISGTGGVITTSIKDGEVISESYITPYKQKASVLSDPDIPITILGKVQELSIRYGSSIPPLLTQLSVVGTALTSLDCNRCTHLSELDVSNCTSIKRLDCGDCQSQSFIALDLSMNTELTSLVCSGCIYLQKLDLSTNTKLTSIECDNIRQIVSIKYRATSIAVASKIAVAITQSAHIGTVHLNPDDPYYSTVATAATNRGWTVEHL